MSIKICKSIGVLYKLNCFLPETILKTLYTSLIHPYLSYGPVTHMSNLLVNRSKNKILCPSQWYDNLEFFT